MTASLMRSARRSLASLEGHTAQVSELGASASASQILEENGERDSSSSQYVGAIAGARLPSRPTKPLELGELGVPSLSPLCVHSFISHLSIILLCTFLELTRRFFVALMPRLANLPERYWLLGRTISSLGECLGYGLRLFLRNTVRGY